MKTNYLRDTLKEGTYNVVPTVESEVTKLAKQKYRRMKSQAPDGNEIEEEMWEPGINSSMFFSQRNTDPIPESRVWNCPVWA